MIYKTIDDVPTNGKELIKDLINRGILESNEGTINLDDIIYKVMIILAKLGLV